MKYYTQAGGAEREYRFERVGTRLRAHADGSVYELDLTLVGDGTGFSLLVDGRSHDLIIERADGALVVQIDGERIAVEVLDERERAARSVAAVRGGGGGHVHAVMPGIVVEVRVAPGDRVEPGQTLVVLEAMKMQNPLCAESGGVVQRVLAAKGEAVAAGALLVEIDTEGS